MNLIEGDVLLFDGLGRPIKRKDFGYSIKNSGSVLLDGEEVAKTHQCVHCGMHFVSVRGSGKTRGFCRNCMGILCGKKECFTCMPFRKKIELYEKGKMLRC